METHNYPHGGGGVHLYHPALSDMHTKLLLPFYEETEGTKVW